MTCHRFALAAVAVLAVVCLPLLPVALADIDGTASVQFQINDRRTVGLNSGVNISINPTPSITFANGTGANSANQIYQATRSLSSGADSVDLNGALTDAYGTSVALVRVKGLYLKNTSTTNSMTFGADGSAPWSTLLNSTGTVTLPPGAFMLVVTPDATGWAVTATTADILKVAGTGTDSYQIAILGATS